MQQIHIHRIAVGREQISVRRKAQRQRPAQVRIGEYEISQLDCAHPFPGGGDGIDCVVGGRGDIERVGRLVEGKAGGPQDECRCIWNVGIADRDRGLLQQLQAPGLHRDVQTRHCAVAHVGDKHVGAEPAIFNGQIPRAVQKNRIGPGLQPVAVAVDHLQRTLTDGVESTVASRHIANDDKSGPQDSERSAEPRQAAGKECSGIARGREWPARPQLDDRRAETLCVGAVVEITDQHVAGRDFSAIGKSPGHKRHAVGIFISVGRNGR